MVAGGMESMSNVPMFENRTSPIYGNRTVKVGLAYLSDSRVGYLSQLFIRMADLLTSQVFHFPTPI